MSKTTMTKQQQLDVWRTCTCEDIALPELEKECKEIPNTDLDNPQHVSDVSGHRHRRRPAT